MLDSDTSSSTACLPQRINLATRPLHTRLNALIISLLPLALPPHTSDPALYAKGLQHIFPIYESFEGTFRLLLMRTVNGEKRTALVEALRRLRMTELEREKRLRRDLSRLTGKSAEGPESTSHLHSFTERILATTIPRPHLLLAYTWVFYMALFSGGRYIRSKLRQAGSAFWDGTTGEKLDNIDDCLSFWTFDGDEDGNDIKADFIRRFSESESCLSSHEKEEVVEEAVYIMDAMVGVVEEIPETLGTGNAAEQDTLAAGQRVKIGLEEKSPVDMLEGEEPSVRWLLLKHILPMGMVELVAGAGRVVSVSMEPLYRIF